MQKQDDSCMVAMGVTSPQVLCINYSALGRPLLFTWGGSEGPPQESSIQDTRYQPRTQWSLTATGTWMPLKTVFLTGHQEGTYFLWVTRKSLNFSLRLSHPGSNIYFSSYRAQGFYKHYWGYVRGSFLSHTGHCSHSHPTGWQLLLAGRPGFCIQNSATTVWVGNKSDSKSGQWH